MSLVQGRLSGSALVRSSFFNLVGGLLPLGVALLAIPTIVDGLGVGRFGVLVLAWIALDYAGLLDLGLGRASTRYVADAIGRNRTDEVPDIVWTSVLLQLVSGLAGGAVLATAAAAIVEQVLSVDAGMRAEAVSVLRLVGMAVPIVLLTSTMRGVLEAGQRFGVVNAIRAPLGMASYVLAAIGARAGWSLPAIVALLVAARVLSLFLFAFHAARLFPGLLRPRAPRFSRYRELIRFGGWVTVSSVVSPALVYLERLVIGAVAGMAALGVYSAPAEVMRRLLTLPTAIVLTLFPALSAMRARTDSDRGTRLVPRALRFLLLALGPAVIAVAALAPELLGSWLGAEFSGEAVVVLRVLAFGVLLNALAFIPFVAIEASGHPDVPARLHLLELPLYAVGSWLLVRNAGIVGAAAAWTLRVTLDALLLFAAGLRLGVLSASSLRAHGLPRAAAHIALTATAAAGAVLLTDTGPIRLLAVAAIAAGSLLVGWRLLDAEERSALRNAFRR